MATCAKFASAGTRRRRQGDEVCMNVILTAQMHWNVDRLGTWLRWWEKAATRENYFEVTQKRDLSGMSSTAQHTVSLRPCLHIYIYHAVLHATLFRERQLNLPAMPPFVVQFQAWMRQALSAVGFHVLLTPFNSFFLSLSVHCHFKLELQFILISQRCKWNNNWWYILLYHYCDSFMELWNRRWLWIAICVSIFCISFTQISHIQKCLWSNWHSTRCNLNGFQWRLWHSRFLNEIATTSCFITCNAFE